MEISENIAKVKVNKLREVTKNWSVSATMMAINEEIQGAKSLEERLELLILKSEILEYSALGNIFKVD